MDHKKLTLVVHGIGEQEAGETLDQLVGAASGEDAGTVKSDIKWMRDQHDKTDPRKVDLFPCHTRSMRVGKKELVFAEVFWADLSTGSRNWIFVLIELISMILGLGYVVRENIEEQYPEEDYAKGKTPPSRFGRLLRGLTDWFVQGLHGPVLVSQLTCAIALLMVYAVLSANKGLSFLNGQLDAILIPLAVILTGLLSLGMHKFLVNREHGYLFSVFVRWLKYFGIGLIVLVVVREIAVLSPLESNIFREIPAMACGGVVHCGFQWYALVLPLIQGIFLVGLVLSGISIAVFQALNSVTWKDVGYSLFPFTCMAMIVLYMSVMAIIWGVFLRFYETIFIFDLLPKEEVERLKLTALATNTPFWVALFIILIATCFIVMKRRSWNKLYLENKEKAGRVPRLILGYPIRVGLTLGMIILFFGTAIMVPAISGVMQGEEFTLDFCEIENAGSNNFGYKIMCYGPIISGFFATAIAFIFPFIIGLLAVGLGVAKDIIGYFSYQKAKDEDGNMIRRYVLRKRINNRMRQVFDRLVKAENPDEIVIISHSQGTVIAIESIREGLFDSIPNELRMKTSLVTMGSPSYHIYSKYFKNRFNPKYKFLLENFKGKMGRWVNIFRADDFVGTNIVGIDETWPRNHAVNPGGHTGYWSDDEVRAHLYREVLDEFQEVAPAE